MNNDIYLEKDTELSPNLAKRGVQYYTLTTPSHKRLGYCYLVTDAALSAKLGHIGYYIAPTHRGQGYAKRALGMLAGLAKKQGMSKLSIHFQADNNASRQVIQSFLATLPHPRPFETTLAHAQCIHFFL